MKNMQHLLLTECKIGESTHQLKGKIKKKKAGGCKSEIHVINFISLKTDVTTSLGHQPLLSLFLKKQAKGSSALSRSKGLLVFTIT